MSLVAYLNRGLVVDGKIRADLAPHILAVGEAWATAGVDPTAVELLSEYMARLSCELGDARIDALALLSATAFADLPTPVLELVQAVAASPLDRRSVAALAVHLVDIVETMAIKLYVPELPALVAKSERTGEAARSVGVARHLRG
jgi:hypothetical protein